MEKLSLKHEIPTESKAHVTETESRLFDVVEREIRASVRSSAHSSAHIVPLLMQYEYDHIALSICI